MHRFEYDLHRPGLLEKLNGSLLKRVFERQLKRGLHHSCLCIAIFL